MMRNRLTMRMLLSTAIAVFLIGTVGCSRVERHTMEVTAYCGCGKCCHWQRGSWKYLNLDFWNRYVKSGPNKGKRYSGRTASGARPRPYDPGLMAMRNVYHPWMIPIRLLFFPWMVLPQDGTLSADTDYYPFGTRMYVPDYGWGVVEDRGSAITGPDRLEVFYRSHRQALKWGRRNVEVEVRK